MGFKCLSWHDVADITVDEADYVRVARAGHAVRWVRIPVSQVANSHVLAELLDIIRSFLNTGGIILWTIFFVSLLLWFLVMERVMYLWFAYPRHKQQWIADWQQRSDKTSRSALALRECMISEAKIAMKMTLPIINVLIQLCPLLGLLGTVTGMIHVFDVMANTGTGNARAMASGVSQATIPTMAGMVIAIAGLYCNKLLQERVSDETHRLADLLTYH